MPHRIIHCALSCAALLAHLNHDSLRSLDGGVVASVSDEVMGSLMTDRNVSLLYFSRSDYDQAVKGLSDPEIDAALRKRLKQWSPRALDRSVAWIAQLQRRALTLTAQAAREASPSEADLFAAHFNRGLDLMAAIFGPGGYDDTDLHDLLTSAVEKDAMLISELGNTGEGQSRTRFAQALAKELRNYNDPEFSKALPYAEPSRGAWVAPVDKGLRSYIDARAQTAIAWRGGVVLSLPLRAIQDFEQEGKKVEILYFDAGQVLQDAADLNATQMSRRFDALSAASTAARAQQKADYLNTLRLNLAVLRRALRLRAAREDTRLPPVLDPQIRAESGILAAEIAHAGSWLQPGDETGGRLAKLREAEEQLRLEAAFFAAYARVRDNAFVAERMREIVTGKQAGIENLARIPR